MGSLKFHVGQNPENIYCFPQKEVTKNLLFTTMTSLVIDKLNSSKIPK